MEEKDDEISIDLGKIKNFFKSKKEDAKPEVKEEAKDSQVAAHADASEIKKYDDEITIDLSKIKNIFKKKGKSAEEKSGTAQEKEENEEDDISFDFSKIKEITKNFFKKDKTKSQGSDDEFNLDTKKLSDFFITHGALFLILIPIFLSIFVRIQPAYLSITDDWASSSVIEGIRSQIRGQINQQYPNLPDQNKDAIVGNELQKVLQQQKSQIDQQIAATSNFFKSKMQDDSGQTYLSTIDPYYWLRYTENIVERGHPGDELKDGIPWDNHMFAPIGRGVPPDMFLAYSTAYIFKFLSFFNANLNLAAVAFFIPALISALAVIPAFFITRKIAGNFGGFVAAAIIAVHPTFLIRTMGGIYDTDGYNVMFPLLITWIFIESLESKSLKKCAVLSAINGLLLGLYSFAWSGWWYIFDFILISIALYIAYYSYVHRDELKANFLNLISQQAIKNSLAFLLIFFVVSGISVSAFVSSARFMTFIKEPTNFARLKEVGITTIWPNVFTTVAEQNPASLDSVIDQVGLSKIFFFLIALMGITLTLSTRDYKKWWFIAAAFAWYVVIFALKVQNLNTFLLLISIPIIIRVAIALWESDKELDIKYAILFIMWFIATVFASTKGVRFVMLVVPAFAIGFGIALGEFYRYSSMWIARGFHVNRLVSKILVIALSLLLLWPTYTSAHNTGRNMVTDFDDAWRLSLERIKEDSKPDAIVNSWWDYGHWFKYWTDRGVTFDGTTQNTPPAHWVGKVLLTSDEKLAVGILRMLDCGSREGFNIISNLTKDSVNAVKIMYEIMPEGRESAEKILRMHFSESDAEKILEKTHCDAPENYFITSGDMIGKSGVWAHFGSWDFDRALTYNTLKKKEYSDDMAKSVQFLKDRFNYSDKDAESLYYEVQSVRTSDQANNWIAPWPGYAGTGGCSKADNETLRCGVSGIPLVVNLTSYEAYAESAQGILHPKEMSFMAKDGVILKKYNESVITLQSGRNLGVALIKDGESYSVAAMDSDLAGSMFTRMFYQEGVGLKYFKKFSDERSIFGSRVIVWKVDWDGIEDEEKADDGATAKNN